MSDEQGLVRVRDVLETASQRFGLSDALRTGMLWERWSSIVGPDVAGHAQPSSLRQGVLRVRADSPTWATEIGYLAEVIRTQINDALGDLVVEEVRAWTGPGSSSGFERAESAPTERTRNPAPRTEDRDDPSGALDRAHEAWARARSRER
jgi:predicted nucleic acid-binding Zn ribbon protein